MGRASRRRNFVRIANRLLRQSPSAGSGASGSRLIAREPSPSPEVPEGKIALLESLDAFAPFRNGIRRVSGAHKEWAGIPMPLDDARLVVEPRHPRAKELMGLGQPRAAAAEDGYRMRNSWWSHEKRGWIVVMDTPDGISWGYEPGMHHLDHDIRTMGCSVAWGLEQESKALRALGELVRHHQLKDYLLSGMFLESSPRSHVTYVFRKLKPTVAIANKGGALSILCTLCLHPIAYYEGSWAGAMCPTDDVIAHLMLMRGDERMLWKRANQHPAWVPESGL